MRRPGKSVSPKGLREFESLTLRQNPFSFLQCVLYCTLAKEYKFSYCISMATGKKLGENLRKLRLKKNMSQGDLATVLSVDRAYISNIENGHMNPTLSTLEKIANVLGISSSELLK